MSTLLPAVLQSIVTPQTTYLELGVLAGQCFSRIHTERKTGVDVSPRLRDPRIFKGTTDLYFAKQQKRPAFDFILVDACHEYSQVCRDLQGCASILQPGGLVFCHDLVPPDREHLSPNYCWDAYRVLAWCLQEKIMCWVTREDFGLVAFPEPSAVTQPPDFQSSWEYFNHLLDQSSDVYETADFILEIHRYVDLTKTNHPSSTE